MGARCPEIHHFAGGTFIRGGHDNQGGHDFRLQFCRGARCSKGGTFLVLNLTGGTIFKEGHDFFVLI